MSTAPYPTTTLRGVNVVATASLRNWDVTIWHTLQFTGPVDGWWVVTVSEGRGSQARFEHLNSEAEARVFGNAAHRILRQALRSDSLITPVEVLEAAVDELAYDGQDEYRQCECEIDWKCPLCQELGRYHSRLDA